MKLVWQPSIKIDTCRIGFVNRLHQIPDILALQEGQGRTVDASGGKNIRGHPACHRLQERPLRCRGVPHRPLPGGHRTTRIR